MAAALATRADIEQRIEALRLKQDRMPERRAQVGDEVDALVDALVEAWLECDG